MTGSAGIRDFLAAIRRRLLLRAGLQAAGYGAAALLLALALLGVAAASVGPAGFWPVVTTIVLSAATLVVLGYGLLRPARALRDDLTAARRAGVLLPDLASDLLSAVELDEPAPPEPRGAPVSPKLIEAFQQHVAGALVPISAKQLVPLRPAAWAIGAALLAAAGMVAATSWSSALSLGLRTLLRRPSLFEGAVVSAAPLVGDVRITYGYPAYTGLAPRTVEGSTGDIAAVKGTHVRVETHPLRTARKALLLLGEAGNKGEIQARLENGTLIAELTLTEDVAYRFWLEPPFGRAVREERSHHITAEADAPPRVEIMGPADRLELATPRPIEIGYAATDDFGLGSVELIYRVGERPEQRVGLRDAGGARTAQGRTLWDPASALLGGAERIAYRIEARDRDAVSGGKIGASRTLYVVIQNAHETLEDRLERQRDLLEKLLTDLADRLERDGTGAEATTPDERLAGAVMVHDAEEARLALLGQLIDEDRRNGSMGKALRTALVGIADRLEKLLREETKALAALKGKATAGGLARLDTHGRPPRRRAGGRRARPRRSDRPPAPGGPRQPGQGADRRAPAAAGPAGALSAHQGRGAAATTRARGARAAGPHRRSGPEDRRGEGPQRRLRGVAQPPRSEVAGERGEEVRRDAGEGERRRPGQGAGAAGRRPARDAQAAGPEHGGVRGRTLPAGEPGGRRADEEDRRHRGGRADVAEGDAGDRRQAGGRDRSGA